MEYIKFIQKPSIQMYPGIRVTKDTDITFNNDNVKQEIKDLKLHSITTIKGDNFESTHDTTIQLEENDILIFEDEERGYIKPVEDFQTIKETIEELSCIEDL